MRKIMSYYKFEEYCEDKRMNYDLSLLTKEVFEKLEYRAAIQGIRLLINREQAYDKEIYGNIDFLRKAIVVLIKTSFYFLNKGDTVHIASRENQIVVILPKDKMLSYLGLQPETVISEEKELASFYAALDYIQEADGIVKMSEEKSEMTITLSSN